MILGVSRHREPSGLCITPSPQHLTSTFSVPSPLFSHFYSSICPATLLTSNTCAFLPKQRRVSVTFLPQPHSFQRFCPASPLTNKTKGNRCASTNKPTNEALSPLESALTQNAPVTPLESALTICTGGGGYPHTPHALVTHRVVTTRGVLSQRDLSQRVLFNAGCRTRIGRAGLGARVSGY